MQRLAILTGASSGIGAAAARAFLEKGFSVISVSRRNCPVQGVITIPTDLSDRVSLNRTLEDLTRKLQAIPDTSACLLHNASVMFKDDCQSTEDEALDKALSVNIRAINTLNRTLIPQMSRASSVLYVGSTLSEKAVKGSFSYIVSKHAQLGMMRATCQDLMGRGIHTAMICPGFTDTNMLRAHIGHDCETLNNLAKMNSYRRLVTPQEIADLIFWAHENPVINGSVIHANLGQLEH